MLEHLPRPSPCPELDTPRLSSARKRPVDMALFYLGHLKNRDDGTDPSLTMMTWLHHTHTDSRDVVSVSTSRSRDGLETY